MDDMSETPNGQLTPEEIEHIRNWVSEQKGGRRQIQSTAGRWIESLVATIDAVMNERDEARKQAEDRGQMLFDEQMTRQRAERERDHARDKLEGTRNWLTRVEGELTAVTRQRDEIARQFDTLVASITPAAASNAEQNQEPWRDVQLRGCQRKHPASGLRCVFGPGHVCRYHLATDGSKWPSTELPLCVECGAALTTALECPTHGPVGVER